MGTVTKRWDVSMNEKEHALAEMLAGQCKCIEDVRELLKRILKGKLDGTLEVEMTEVQ